MDIKFCIILLVRIIDSKLYLDCKHELFSPSINIGKREGIKIWEHLSEAIANE